MNSLAALGRRVSARPCVVAVATCLFLLPWDPARSHDTSQRFGAAAAAKAREALTTLPVAVKYFRQGRYDEATAAFQQIASQLPGVEHAPAAAALTGLGEPVAYRRTLAGIYGNLGTAHFRARRYEAALAALRQAIDIDPFAAGPRLTLALVLKHQRRYLESAAAFDEALALGPRSSKEYLDFGEVAFKAGEPRQARAALAHALHLSRQEEGTQAWGTALEAELTLAQIDQAEGRTAAAESGLRSVLERAPGEVRARYRLTQLLLRKGAVTEAERHRQRFERDAETMASIQSMLAGTPGGVAGLHWIADTYARLGLLHFAEVHYLQLLARVPDDAEVRRDLQRVRAHARKKVR